MKKEEEGQQQFLKSEAQVIFLFALSLFLFLSNFKVCGVVGRFFRGLQLGLLGVVGYLFPVLLFLTCVYAISNRENRRALIKVPACFLAAISIAAIIHLFFGQEFTDLSSLGEFYLSGKGGGLIGGGLSGLCRVVLGKAGAFILLSVIFIISMVCITEKSFVSAVRTKSGNAYRHAKEDLDRRRTEHEEEAAERKKKRDEMLNSGVNFDALDLSNADDTVTMPETAAAGAGNAAGAENAAGANAGVADEAGMLSGQNAGAGGMDAYAGAAAGAAGGAAGYAGNMADNGAGYAGNMAGTGAGYAGSLTGVGGGYAGSAAGGRSGQAFAADFSTPDDAVRPEDEFRGTIRKPVDYDVDTVPFDAPGMRTEKDEALEGALKKADAILSGREEAEAGSENGGGAAGETPDEVPFAEKKTASAETGDGEREYPDPTRDAYYQQTLDTVGGERSIKPTPDERVIMTASGKVLKGETAAVKSRMTEARKETELGQVKETIREKEVHKKPYFFPPVNLLERGKRSTQPFSDKEYRDTAVKLQQTLKNFGVGVTVTNISCGPVVTRYELHPEQGVKVSRIVALSDDIKLSLAASDIRIEAPIPGKSAVGIEVPNKENNLVYLRDLLESEEFRNNRYKIAFAVGKDIAGQIVVTDIAKMPHLLIAGATGSGKSVCINTLIMSVLYKYKPEEVKLIMIDPKVVELSVYNGIPHLLIPVVTDPKKAAGALNWAVAEMTDRYKKFAAAGVRDLRGYNDRIETASATEMTDEQKAELPEKMPQIVIIIDELADLMMVAQNEVEEAICRLAQLARAAGLHLVIATQRPSVNVITGLIKANIPSRIAFAVSSGVDSRTILDGVGAEKLLGKGDMLFSPQGAPKPMRVQGAFVSDKEVQKVIDFILKQGFSPAFDAETVEKISQTPSELLTHGKEEETGGRDELFAQAGRFIIEKDKASIGNLQRMFKIGFNRAARIMDQLCEAGVVGEEQGTKPREILMDTNQFEDLVKNS